MEKRATFSSTTIGLLFIAPMLVLIFVFFYWPSGQALYWAFTLEQPWGGGNQWVGFQNFAQLLSDPVYWNSISRSPVFGLASTAIAMGVALILGAVHRSRAPLPPRLSLDVRLALCHRRAGARPRLPLHPGARGGPAVGDQPHLARPLNPALDGTDAMIAIIVAFSWKYIGYNFIFFLSALAAIPRSLIEAAAMDGAGPARRVFDVQLPLLTPTLFFLLVINITESFQDSFGIVDIMTQGGPARATELMVYKIYFDGFKGLDYSGAAAQSIILMLLVILLTIAQFRFIERRVHYK